MIPLPTTDFLAKLLQLRTLAQGRRALAQRQRQVVKRYHLPGQHDQQGHGGGAKFAYASSAQLDGYRLALMGFDFEPGELPVMRQKFKAYLKGQGVTANGDMDALNHSWEFAAYHLPGQHDQQSHGGDGGGTKDRAFTGQPVATKTTLSKQETGALGERLAQQLTGATPMNGKWNNFPIDMVRGNTVYEVKAGLASNRFDAQKWRLTIGEPGKKEKEWLARASLTAKQKWNNRKADLITERKRKMMTTLRQKLGRPVEAKTLAFIVNPDKKLADVYEFNGFHSVIRWRSELANAAYKKTIKYG